MTTQSHSIARVQEEENAAKKMLNHVENENNVKIQKATENAEALIQSAEQEAKKEANVLIEEAKEKGKAEYKNILSAGENETHRLVESAQKNVPKAKKYIEETFLGLFE